MKKTLFSVVNKKVDAENILTELRKNKFPEEDLSIIFSDSSPLQPEGGETAANRSGFVYEVKSKTSEAAAIGLIIGGIFGGFIGLLMGMGSLAIPGMGPFIAAGPILSALAGSAIGAFLGFLIGALAG